MPQEFFALVAAFFVIGIVAVSLVALQRLTLDMRHQAAKNLNVETLMSKAKRRTLRDFRKQAFGIGGVFVVVGALFLWMYYVSPVVMLLLYGASFAVGGTAWILQGIVTTEAELRADTPARRRLTGFLIALILALPALVILLAWYAPSWPVFVAGETGVWNLMGVVLFPLTVASLLYALWRAGKRMLGA